MKLVCKNNEEKMVYNKPKEIIPIDEKVIIVSPKDKVKYFLGLPPPKNLSFKENKND